MSIGERITGLRKSAKLSQGQLATIMGISRQAVSKWENDQSSPDTLNLIQLADVLNTDVEFLATGKQAAVAEPVVVKTVEVQEKIVEVEKIVEKPVIQYVEKPVETIVEKIVEKPIIKKVMRIRYIRNPFEFFAFGSLCFILGLFAGFLIR